VVEDPPRGTGRSDLAEQHRLIPQHRAVADRAATIGERHRQIGQHPTRVVGRTAFSQACQRVGERLGQSGPDQPSRPGVGTRHATRPRSRPWSP
jgi:hypothetical protein